MQITPQNPSPARADADAGAGAGADVGLVALLLVASLTHRVAVMLGL